MEEEWFSTSRQQAALDEKQAVKEDPVDGGYTTDDAREEMEYYWFGIPRQQAAGQPVQPKQLKQPKSNSRFQARAAGAKKFGAYKPRR